METHVIKTKIRKRGYLELKNLPFKEGTAIEVSIEPKKFQKSCSSCLI